MLDLPRICFVHIPKTAGTTLYNLFAQWYPDTLRCHFTPWQGMDYNRKDLERYRFYHGHIHYHALRQILPDDTHYITLLREPVVRCISHHAQIQRAAVAEIGVYQAEMLGANLTLEEYVHNPATEITNMQTRYLAAQYPVSKCSDIPALIRDELTRTAQGDYPTAQDALTVLKDMACWGVTEHFGAFVEHLCKRFGLPAPAAIDAHNVSTDRAQPDTHILGEIMRRNEQDIQLYSMATQTL